MGHGVVTVVPCKRKHRLCLGFLCYCCVHRNVPSGARVLAVSMFSSAWLPCHKAPVSCLHARKVHSCFLVQERLKILFLVPSTPEASTGAPRFVAGLCCPLSAPMMGAVPACKAWFRASLLCTACPCRVPVAFCLLCNDA
jgi:hypothetical protein